MAHAQTVLFRDAAVRELITHLRSLVKIDTSNPPGRESAAALYVKKAFEKEGIKSNILEKEKGRGNIIARIKGRGNGRPLLLMSHLDVVGAESGKWKEPPFSGKLKDGFVWGRGTLDCKNTCALWMMLMILIKRSGIVPRRDLIFLSTADEEMGHNRGMDWLSREHYPLIDAEAALNEGGGFAIEFAGQTFYTCQNAEKGNLWMKFSASGESGHASVPGRFNPLEETARLASKVARLRFPLRRTETVKKMVASMSRGMDFPAGLLLRQVLNPLFSGLILKHPGFRGGMADNFNAMLRNTACPTVMRSGLQTNVIPAEAFLEVDFRMLPGYDPVQMSLFFKKFAGEAFTMEILDARKPTESPFEHPLVSAMDKAVKKHDSGAQLVPLMIPGVTDACFLRQKGMSVYGFTPLLPADDISLTHGHNEKISVASLEFGLKTVCLIAEDYAL